MVGNRAQSERACCKMPISPPVIRPPSGNRVTCGLLACTQLLLTFFITIGQSSTTACAARRNSTDYDVFGPYTVPRFGEVGKVYADMREFVWTHWREKRRASAVVITSSIQEGIPCTKTAIVEPDKMGQWYLEVKTECKKGSPRTSKATAYSLERLKRDSAGRWAEEKLSDTAEASGGTYIIRLLDRSGIDVGVL